MQLESLKHLDDARKACRLLDEFIAGKTFEEYEADAMFRSAVERQLGIVGEALTRLRKTEPSVLATITDSRRIIDFRNLLVHGYDVIQDKVVWGIIEKNLPVLTVEILRLIDNEGANPPDQDTPGS